MKLFFWSLFWNCFLLLEAGKAYAGVSTCHGDTWLSSFSKCWAFPMLLENQGKGWARTKGWSHTHSIQAVQQTQPYRRGSCGCFAEFFPTLSPWAGLMLLWITVWHLSCSRGKCFSSTWTWLVLWLFVCWEPRLKSSREKGSFCRCLCVQLCESVPTARQEQSSYFH